jgi:hypothetical protein
MGSRMRSGKSQREPGATPRFDWILADANSNGMTNDPRNTQGHGRLFAFHLTDLTCYINTSISIQIDVSK